MIGRQMFRGGAVMPQAARLARGQTVRGYASAPNAGSAMDRVKDLGASIAKMAERALGSYAEPLVYYTKVAGALAKQVYIAEKLAPPTSVQTILGAYRTMWEKATNLSFWTHTVPAGEWKSLLVYGVEALGFFSVGEIIGKRRLIGYRVDTHGQDVHH